MRWQKKHVFGSEAKLAGKGCQTYALWVDYPFSFFVCRETKISPFYCCRFWSRSLVPNVLPLCVRAGFGAQNCQPAPKLNRSTNLHVCTSARLTQNGCYRLAFLSSVLLSFSVECNFLHFPTVSIVSNCHTVNK